MGFDATGDKPYNPRNKNLLYTIIGIASVAAICVYFAGPKFFGRKAVDIAQIVEGRSSAEAAGAIYAYGFPDKATSEFFRHLKEVDPVEHAELMIAMGDAALKGADRNALTPYVTQWAVSYAARNSDAIARTDPRLFDRALELTAKTAKLASRSKSNLCDLGAARRVLTEPQLAQVHIAHDSKLYALVTDVNMLVADMVASGKANSLVVPPATAEDAVTIRALTSGDEGVARLMEAFSGSDEGLDGVNACAAAMTFGAQFSDMPAEARVRIWNSLIRGGLARTS